MTNNKRSWIILTDMIGRLEVRCDQCQRRGVYRVDRLLLAFGDLPLSEALQEIARNGGCYRALNPLPVNHISFATSRCQIKRVLR